jgi:predicted membrane-bound dolichyl-phosphate-mannose-protein mannosyltransferase
MSIAILVMLFLVIVLTRFFIIPKLATNDAKASNIHKLSKYDYAIMLVGTIAYALFSYHHIGSFQQDPVWYGDTSGKEINIILKEPMKISKLSLNTCFDPSNVTKIYAQTADKKTIDFAVSKTEKGVDPTCGVISLDNKESNVLLDRIKLRVTQPNMIVYKFMVYNDKDEPIYNYAYYFDSDKNLDNPEGIFSAPESAMTPFKTQYTHMIFDEKYYALNAYHYLHKNAISDINPAHPQLAILLEAVGIKVFGMNPFGWRFIPNLFGVLLLPLVFLFARRLFNRTSVATLAMLFVSVDFMHFTISRMALLESTVTFFIIASYYFLWRYIQLRSIDTKKAFISLFYTGVMVGVAMACKWSGGFILPMLFAIVIYTEYKQSKNIRQYLVILVSLVLVPSLIYLACYIPYIWVNKLHYWQSFAVLQSAMFTIHDKLAVGGNVANTTMWWTWPLAINTILLDFQINIFNTNSYSLVLMGNPLLWWASIPVFITLLVLAIKERNKVSGFILLAIIMQYLPYMIAKREMYLYYYYSISILVFIGLAYSVYRLFMCYKASRFYAVLAIVYVILAIGVFVAYYPVYAGVQTDFGYAYRDLSWIPSWSIVIPPKI